MKISKLLHDLSLPPTMCDNILVLYDASTATALITRWLTCCLRRTACLFFQCCQVPCLISCLPQLFPLSPTTGMYLWARLPKTNFCDDDLSFCKSLVRVDECLSNSWRCFLQADETAWTCPLWLPLTRQCPSLAFTLGVFVSLLAHWNRCLLCVAAFRWQKRG
jgi:hypothetical protein